MMLKDNLKKYRKIRGLNQKELSKNSHISYSMVSKLETGEQSNPSLDTLSKLAIALDTDVEKLLAKESNEFKGFINYLESLDLVLNIETIPLSSYKEDMIDDEGIMIGEADIVNESSFEVTIVAGDKEVIYTKEEFEEFQKDMKDRVEYTIWKKHNN